MADKEFWTFALWQMRAGSSGTLLEQLTRDGIVPQYGQVPGVKGMKLFYITEMDDAKCYMAVTVYESREAYLKWWNEGVDSPRFLEWNNKNKGVLDRWLDNAHRIRVHNAEAVLDITFPPGTKKIEL